mmetsp:Transcript_77767/g.224819  ORF Transcript_77767/g.224819 Transcript_77767/m.224819 type:complete len:242 (+) Transcript_77767:351-1076(+)
MARSPLASSCVTSDSSAKVGGKSSSRNGGGKSFSIAVGGRSSSTAVATWAMLECPALPPPAKAATEVEGGGVLADTAPAAANSGGPAATAYSSTFGTVAGNEAGIVVATPAAPWPSASIVGPTPKLLERVHGGKGSAAGTHNGAPLSGGTARPHAHSGARPSGHGGDVARSRRWISCNSFGEGHMAPVRKRRSKAATECNRARMHLHLAGQRARVRNSTCAPKVCTQRQASTPARTMYTWH